MSLKHMTKYDIDLIFESLTKEVEFIKLCGIMNFFGRKIIYVYSIKFNGDSEETIISMIKDAVEVESEFIRECLPYSLVGMNKSLMTQYIEYVADRKVISCM